MMTSIPFTSTPNGRIVMSVTCFVVGSLFAGVSVYSTSRASCALWVTVAVVLVFVSGFLARSRRPGA